MIVGRLAPPNQWDQNQLEQTLTGPWHDGYPNTNKPLTLIIPGRYWHDRPHEISAAIARYPQVTAIRVGDEEDLFDTTAVEHPNINWWIQSPHTGRDYGTAQYLGVGWTPKFNELPDHPPTKALRVFLAGQNTHTRRHEAFDALNNYRRDDTIIYETNGFTKGLTPARYVSAMLDAKVAPCPSGAVCPDTFRLWEALQAHAVPIADDISPTYNSTGFWRQLLPDAPFPVITRWADVNPVITETLKDWPNSANQTAAWWMRHKHATRQKLVGDTSPITVVVPVSPIPSHPDTLILDDTLASIRHHLPDAPILVTFDGVRAEDEHRRTDYEEHTRRALWRLDHHHGNARAIIFDKHTHQVGMMREALNHITTPLVMYVESDTPLIVDEPINIDAITDFILAGRSHLVRLHHESVIPEAHQHMIHGEESHNGTDFIRTSQWSQRPHIATTRFYRRILHECFTPEAVSFIEDKMHGVCSEAYNIGGRYGLRQYRLHIYAGNPNNLKHSYHIDGRGGAPKYEDSQTF